MPSSLKPNERYTYADLLKWPEDERWELIDGVPYAMAAPNLRHQDILLNLGSEFREHLRNKKCRVFIAPCDVRLYANKSDEGDNADNTVVQPDLLVVCDPDKFADGKAIKGAADLVIEILSPSNPKHDRIKKFQKYRKAGVIEIWFIDPEDSVIETFRLDKGRYIAGFHNAEDIVPVGILPGFEVNMKDIF